jgi:hypothetical protein
MSEDVYVHILTLFYMFNMKLKLLDFLIEKLDQTKICKLEAELGK